MEQWSDADPDDPYEQSPLHSAWTSRCCSGIRPGQKTAEYVERVLSRITLSGAIYLCVVRLLPTILVRQFNVPFYFGGTALLIVVGVALDTVAQMETHLISRNYEGFMKRGRLRGRKG